MYKLSYHTASRRFTLIIVVFAFYQYLEWLYKDILKSHAFQRQQPRFEIRLYYTCIVYCRHYRPKINGTGSQLTTVNKTCFIEGKIAVIVTVNKILIRLQENWKTL